MAWKILEREEPIKSLPLSSPLGVEPTDSTAVGDKVAHYG